MAASASPMELEVDLGPMPPDANGGNLTSGLRLLLDRQELCDVSLVATGRSFGAHRAVLAAACPRLLEALARLPAGEDKVQIDDVSHPEAVQTLLDCFYGPASGGAWEYSAGTEDENRDVLRLARRFDIPELREQACRWLTRGLSTANVLQRLVTVEEFGLSEVRERLLEQLTANPEALFAFASDSEAVRVPAVLQDMLVRVLKLLGCGSPPAPKATKAARDGGTARRAGA